MTARNFGELLRRRRLETIDPSTGQAYTQARLAELIQQRVADSGETVSRSLAQSWESTPAKPDPPVPAVEFVKAICHILEIPETEAVRALGFDLGPDPLTQDEKDLLAAFRRLRRVPILQAGALRSVQGLAAMPANPPQSVGA